MALHKTDVERNAEKLDTLTHEPSETLDVDAAVLWHDFALPSARRARGIEGSNIRATVGLNLLE